VFLLVWNFFFVVVDFILISVLLDHLDDIPESTLDALPEMLPVVAPHLLQMVEADCLDLCIYRVEALTPLLGVLKGKPEYVLKKSKKRSVFVFSNCD
jgi:hypothetical protein